MSHEKPEWDAWIEFEHHILNCEHAPEEYYQRVDEATIRREDFFEDAYQIKMVDDLVKVKWESPCSWVGCVWHLYYCRMSRVDWKTPYEFATETDPGQQTLLGEEE